MKLFQEGKHITWMVWALVGVGVLGGIITIALVGWTTSSIRSDRARLLEHEQQWMQISEAVRQLAFAGQEEVKTLLEGDLELQAKRESIDALGQLIQRYQESGDAQDIPSEPLSDLGRYASDLDQLWKKVFAWRTEFQGVEKDVQHQRTLGDVRSIVHKFKLAVEKAEGQRRLKDVIALKRWQNAKGEDASQLARKYLAQKNAQQNNPVLGLGIEIAELSKLH